MLPITSSRMFQRWMEDADQHSLGDVSHPSAHNVTELPPLHDIPSPAKPVETVVVQKEILPLKKDADFVALQRRLIALESESVSLRQKFDHHLEDTTQTNQNFRVQFAGVKVELQQQRSHVQTVTSALRQSITDLEKNLDALRGEVNVVRSNLAALRQDFIGHESNKVIHNASKFHYLEAKRFFPIGFNPAPQLLKTVDTIFRNRSAFNPRLAAWVYTSDFSEEDDENSYFIVKIVLATQEPVSTLVMTRLLEHADYTLTYKSLEYMTFRKLFYDNQSRFNRVNKKVSEDSTYAGLEYWYYVALINPDTNAYLNPQQTDTVFSKSDNYKRSEVVQNFLMERIYDDNDLDELAGESLRL